MREVPSSSHARTIVAFTVCFALVAVQGVAAAPPELQAAMGDPIKGLTPAQLLRFQKGRTAFDSPLTEAQGLGPIFNQNRCGACHNAPLGGSGTIFVTRFGTTDKGEFNPLDELGGSLLQAEAISDACKEVVPDEATIQTHRITNSALGFGLVEAIPDADIEYWELFPPAGPAPVGDPFNPTSITGRVHWVHTLEDPTGPLRAGRMGWKAQVATVLTFSGDASKNEMGLTNALEPEENAPNGDLVKLAMCDSVADPEDQPDGEGVTLIERFTDFQRFLAAPPQTPKSGMAGEVIFHTIGCAQCHVSATYTTPDDPSLEDALRNKTFKPYSDFLLHNMGNLGDGIAQGDATGFEFRTPLLWGLRKRDPMLHDGRALGVTFAERVTNAILEHGAQDSEATISATMFQALSVPDKNKLIAFLDSLGKREFDWDGNDMINATDLAGFKGCFGGGPYTPDDPCAVHDVAQDGSVDAEDLTAFLTVYEGWKGDCNKNGTPDPIDIVMGVLSDADFDGYPDSCCPGDLNNDQKVDQSDLGILLAAYLVGPGGDLDGDGDTDQSDLGLLLSLYLTSCL